MFSLLTPLGSSFLTLILIPQQQVLYLLSKINNEDYAVSKTVVFKIVPPLHTRTATDAHISENAVLQYIICLLHRRMVVLQPPFNLSLFFHLQT